MKTIEFRYNRHKGNMIEGLVMGIFWISGFMLWIYLYNHVFVFDIGGYPTPYWEQHKELWLTITILVPIIWAIVAVYPAGKIHPILYIYTLHINSKKYVLTESYREGYKKTSLKQRWKKERVNLSLAEAMSTIETFVTMHSIPQEKERKHTLFIGNIPIILGDTLSSVFDNSLYYVEYDNLVRAEGVPLVTCLVRERANPIHVVGDIGFADDAQHRSALSEAILRTLPIIDGAALNERIANAYVM